jgi:FolB domain-containing protein
MADSIHIHKLEVHALVGVYKKEQGAPQKLLVSIGMKVESIPSAARSDDLQQTIDYSAVAATVKKIAAEKPRKLIETLAEEMAAVILKIYPVEEVTVEVEKFPLPDARSVSVRITRGTK